MSTFPRTPPTRRVRIARSNRLSPATRTRGFGYPHARSLSPNPAARTAAPSSSPRFTVSHLHQDKPNDEPRCFPLLIAVEAEVGYEVLELHLLNKEVVLRVEPGCAHRALEVKREPLLHAAHPRSLRKVQKQGEVEDYGSGQDRIAGQKVYLDLHRVAQPAEDVYAIPALLGVATRRVVVDLNEVRDVPIELGVLLRLEYGVQHAELGDLLALEALGVFQDLSVAVAQDVRRVPAFKAEHPGLEAWGDYRFH